MFQNALGLVETRGLVGSIEALDAMTKASEVAYAWRESSGGGYHAVIVRGSVGAVKAATEAGASAAARVGAVVTVHVIPKPDPQIERILPRPPAVPPPHPVPCPRPQPQAPPASGAHSPKGPKKKGGGK